MKNIVMVTLFGTILYADISPKELMSQMYGKYDTSKKCWQNGEYCMKIDHYKNLDCDTGKRLYLLATGTNIDTSHASSGAVGAFVVELQNGKSVVIAQNKSIAMGSFGESPTGWKLIKLAPSDYWGWINTYGYMGQGYANSWYTILAPFGKNIKNIAPIVKSQNNSGVAEVRITDLDSTLSVDTSSKDSKIYPIIVTVHGQNNGKKIKPTVYKMPFDFKKWIYKEPKNYILGVY